MAAMLSLAACATVACAAASTTGQIGFGPDELETERRCQTGSTAACTELGRRLVDHTNSHRDVSRGLVLLEVACGQDDLAACAAAASAYVNRSQDPKSVAHAHELAARACERRLGAGCTALGETISIETDDIGAGAESFRSACQLGDADGCERYGLFQSSARLGGDPALADQAFAAGCSLGRRSACHLLAMARIRNPATRRQGADMLFDNCAHDHTPSCTTAALFGAPLISAGPACPRILDFAAKGCAGKDSAACAVEDACKLAIPAEAPAARHRLRSACDRRVPLACLYWADAEESTPPGPEDPQQVRRAYTAACRGADAAHVACPRLAAADLTSAKTQADADHPLAALREACEQSSGEACCALSAAHRSGQWVPADPAKSSDLRDRACNLGAQACCPTSSGGRP